MSDIVLSRPVPDALPVAIAKYVVQHLTTELQGKRYVTVAGATAVASALGYSVREAEGGSRYVRKTEDLPGYWECTAEVLDPSGAVIGRGTGMVADDESPWNRRQHFARRAMASTRAAGRALRLAVGHLFAGLGAGVQSVTLEEMPEVEYEPPKASTPAKAATPPASVFPPPDEEAGEFTGVLVKAWPPRPGKKGIGIDVETPEGKVKLGVFKEHHVADCRELEGSDVVVSWRRSKDGKYLNLEGILATKPKALPKPPPGDPDQDVPF